MLRLLIILVQLTAEAVRWCGLVLRSQRSIEVENLFLRRQLALYMERGVKPRRMDSATRIALALLARLFDWRDALVVVRPETLIRWHRAGWKLFWRLKSRPGRPPIPLEVKKLIRRMANENPSWGEERIANELLLKLDIRVSPRTVNKYLPRRPTGRPRGDMRWSTFLRLHAPGDHCVRLFPSRHGNVSTVVRIRDHRASEPMFDSLQRHRASDCGLDAAAVA